jgi:chromosome segregation ATPase
VDASELARVFDLQQAVRNGTDAVQQGAQGTDVAATAATVAPNAALEQEVAVLKARLEGVEAQLAREREVSEDLQKRLDDAQEERRGLQRLIPPPQEPRPERRTASWWPWRR